MGVNNPDSIQKTIRSNCEKIYPPIVWRSTVYEKESKLCIRVEIEYSGDTPHFSGPAYVRKGSETVKASDETFQRLIDLRSNKVCEVSKWIDKEVVVVADLSSLPRYRDDLSGLDQHTIRQMEKLKWAWAPTIVKVLLVNNFWVTVEKIDDRKRHSFSIEKIYLSYDDKNSCLKLHVRY